MKSVIVLALALCSVPAFARTNTTNLSCADAKDLVAREGSIVLSTGAPGLYARFVADGRYCGSSEQAAPAYVTTADAASCNLGYYCASKTGGDVVGAKVFPAKILACKAGSTSTDYVYNGTNHPVAVAKVCNAAGKWVNADGSVPAKAVKYACQEGKIRTEYFPNLNRGVTGQVQCRGGKWIRIN